MRERVCLRYVARSCRTVARTARAREEGVGGFDEHDVWAASTRQQGGGRADEATTGTAIATDRPPHTKLLRVRAAPYTTGA